MERLKKILLYKKSKCPYCGTNLRFPIHKGKKLKIICPNCKNAFIVEIQHNPLSIFNQIKDLKNIKKLYNENPLLFYGILVITLVILYYIINAIFGFWGGSGKEIIPTDGKII